MRTSPWAPSNLGAHQPPRSGMPKTAFLDHLFPTAAGNRRTADPEALGRGSKPVRQTVASLEVRKEHFDGLFGPIRARLPDQPDGGQGPGGQEENTRKYLDTHLGPDSSASGSTWPAANTSGGPQEIAGSGLDEQRDLAGQAARITAGVPRFEGGSAQAPLGAASVATLEELIDTTAGFAFSFLAFGVFAPHRDPGAPSGQGLPCLASFPAPAGPSGGDDFAGGQGVAEMFVETAAKARSGPGVDHAPAGSALRLAQTPHLLADPSPALGEAGPSRSVVREAREAAGRERAAATSRLAAETRRQGQVQLALNEADGRVNVLIGAPGLSASDADRLRARASDLVRSAGEALGEFQVNGRALTGRVSNSSGGPHGSGAN